MKYNEVDPNLIVKNKIDRDDVEWFDIRQAPFRIYGLFRAEDPSDAFRRMPKEIADNVNAGVADLNYNTAGGRVRFSTDSPFVAIHCETNEPFHIWTHMPLTVSQGFDLYAEDKNDGSDRFVRTFFPAVDPNASCFEALIETPAVLRNYTVNFPLYGTVKTVFIGIKKGCKLGAGRDYRDIKPVLYYGSSITQGGCASRPGACYQAHIAQKYNLDYINLGFSGSARGEKIMVDYLCAQDMSMFVCDYDHNAPTAEHLRNTLPPLFDAMRKAHPDLPILLISAPISDERRAIVRGVYENAVANGDKKVWYVDGTEWFAGEMPEECTVDTCHPTDLGFFRMFKAFEPAIAEALGLTR